MSEPTDVRQNEVLENVGAAEAKALADQQTALVEVVAYLLERRRKRLKGQTNEEGDDAEHRS